MNLVRNARISSDSTKPSVSHLACAAAQSSSSTRMLRTLRMGLGIGCESLAFVGGLGRSENPAVEGDGPDFRADFHDVDEACGGFGHVGVFADFVPVHEVDCTHERKYAQGVEK